jgi:hypothetical protein
MDDYDEGGGGGGAGGGGYADEEFNDDFGNEDEVYEEELLDGAGDDAEDGFGGDGGFRSDVMQADEEVLSVCLSNARALSYSFSRLKPCRRAVQRGRPPMEKPSK